MSRGLDLGCVVVLKVGIFFQEGGRLLCCTDETIIRSAAANEWVAMGASSDVGWLDYR